MFLFFRQFDTSVFKFILFDQKIIFYSVTFIEKSKIGNVSKFTEQTMTCHKVNKRVNAMVSRR